MSAPCKFASSQEAKKAGFFSRRHENSQAFVAAKESREAKTRNNRQNAEERARLAASRSPREQLELLDRRLGVGVGAKKERARLKLL